MRADTVQNLMCDVVHLAQSVDMGGNNFRFVSAGLNKVQQHQAAFLLNYNDMAAGWKAAAMFAKAHARLPVYLTTDDYWIWRAYLVHCNPNLYFDKHVAEAEALTDSSMMHQRHTLQGFLLSDDADFKDIAQMTGLSEDTIIAYEKLFFNVKDRVKDYMFLAKQVYPHGRLEELYDHYLHTTTFGDLLRRVGYNCGKDYVGFMAGLKSTLIKDLSVGDMASKLERVVMANGFVLASSGLINQRTEAQSLRTAQSMINAAKAGGMESQEQSGFDDIKVSIALRGEMELIGRDELKANQATMKKMYMPTIDVIAEEVAS